MVDYRTLSRIASAQYDAQRMRLPGTADRLDILRKELERYHELPSDRQEIRRKWAIAKLEDIERTFRDEKGRLDHEDKEYFDQMKAISKTIKTAIYLFFTVNVISTLGRGVETMSDMFLAIGTNAIIALLASSAAGRFIGGNFDEVAKNIENAISECRNTLKGPGTEKP
jgi:hypothetical protein